MTTSLLPGDMVEKALASDVICLESDRAFYGRDEMVCADGKVRTFDFIKVRLAHNDEHGSGLVGFAIDVTEKLAAEIEQTVLEQQVQHSQRLESLGVMAGGIAHDFNNLLMVIQGNIELARLEDDLSESMQESLACVDSAANAATGLCRQMLDYSGKAVMRFSDVDMKPGSYAVLKVQGNGMGMDAATAGRMFDPFFTTKFTGRGLGLSALLGILRAHDAGIEVQSRLGEGTTMSVWLPEIDSAAYVHSAGAGDVKRALSGRVLLVDDESTVLHVTARMLSHLGLTVTSACSGQEAIDLFVEDSDFDWVLLDVTMPHMGGLECLQKLREIRPDIYVAMSSGFASESALAPDNRCPPDDFISKPFTLEALRCVVAKAETANSSTY